MNENLQILDYKPKYILIADMVRKQIQSGRFKKGDKLFSDDELALKYKVNARTIAAGLNALVKEGLLERAPGRGTIVVRNIENNKVVSNAVGMVMFSKGDVYSDICLKISQGLMHRKLYPVLINENVVDKHLDSVITYLDQMTGDEQRPYGMIIDGNYGFPFDHLFSNPSRFENIVFITKYHHPERIGHAKYALVDFAAAGRMAARYFINKGYKKLACLASHEEEYPGSWSSMQVMIMQGFAEVCQASNVRFSEDLFWKLLHGAPFEKTVGEVLDSKDCPDAIFAYPDYFIRSKIIPLLESKNMKPVKDVNLIGFYNTHHAEECGFSSICINEEKIADAAVKLLTNETQEQDILIQPELIIRQPKP